MGNSVVGEGCDRVAEKKLLRCSHCKLQSGSCRSFSFFSPDKSEVVVLRGVNANEKGFSLRAYLQSGLNDVDNQSTVGLSLQQ